MRCTLEAHGPDIVDDLREINKGRLEKYSIFWEAVQRFIEASALQAVDSRRHGSACHLAMAFSASDFLRQVAECLPEDSLRKTFCAFSTGMQRVFGIP